jgi:hypothetical protein
MTGTILSIILAILTCAIGIWKYMRGKERKHEERIEDAKKLIEQGIEDADISAINRGFDRLRRMR